MVFLTIGMRVDVEHQTLGGISRKCLFFLDAFVPLPLSPNEGFVGFIALCGAHQHQNLVKEL